MHSAEQEVLRQEIASYIDACGGDRHALLHILEETHQRQKSLSPEAMQAIAERLAIPPAEVYSVASFYPTLDSAPCVRFAIRLCGGVSCGLAGKDDLAGHLERNLGIAFGAATPDGLFSLDWADCLGLCDQGPALRVNERVYTHVTPALADEILAACRQAATDGDEPDPADLPQPSPPPQSSRRRWAP
jgi:[NiFe] hydrogenase diaphorase moiety large subunit